MSEEKKLYTFPFIKQNVAWALAPENVDMSLEQIKQEILKWKNHYAIKLKDLIEENVSPLTEDNLKSFFYTEVQDSNGESVLYFDERRVGIKWTDSITGEVNSYINEPSYLFIGLGSQFAFKFGSTNKEFIHVNCEVDIKDGNVNINIIDVEG